jgi:F0F1-type ATP synthase gamma subunit
MLSPRRLRDELRFVAEFHTIFDVIQQTAVTQLQRLEPKAGQGAAASALIARDILQALPAAAGAHPLVRGGRTGRLLVVLTSDEGLVGPLHALVARRARELAGDGTRWMLVGQRALRLLAGVSPRVRSMPMPREEEAPARLRRLSQAVLAQYEREGLRDALLVAPRFVSRTRQEIAAVPLLPLALPAPAASGARETVFEPSVEAVVRTAAAVWLEAVCVERYWSARRAEFAARALQMESSRQELGQQTRRLRHQFFKTMHKRVDVMVRETCVVQRLTTARTGRGR